MINIRPDTSKHLNISEMAARRAAGLVIFRCKEGAPGQAEWLLLQTSYGKNHW